MQKVVDEAIGFEIASDYFTACSFLSLLVHAVPTRRYISSLPILLNHLFHTQIEHVDDWSKVGRMFLLSTKLDNGRCNKFLEGLSLNTFRIIQERASSVHTLEWTMLLGYHCLVCTMKATF